MNFILTKITPDGNGFRDKREKIGISDNKKSLIDFCKTEYDVTPLEWDQDVHQKDYINGDMWSGYLTIETTNIKII